MSFDYLNDPFGKSRAGSQSKFTDLEKRAKDILWRMHGGRLSYDEFFEAFTKILKEFNELSGKEINQDTPLWINMFGANVFLRWRDWHLLRTMYANHPERFNTPELKEEYRNIEDMNLDRWLKDKIEYCVNNFS